MDKFPFLKIRIARPTSRLEDVVAFYTAGLGLRELSRFENHDGYDGVMIGLPGWQHHLEFTRHPGITDCDAPTKDNLLVFYLPKDKRDEIADRLIKLGAGKVSPENPYWETNGITFEDPDRWRIVLVAE